MLGSAQFGMRYGIVNHIGVPDDRELRAILDLAAARGIDWVDTARSYGSAESRLGTMGAPCQSRIVTKIAPLAMVMATTGLTDPAAATRRSLADSLAALDAPRVEVAMLHHADDAARAGVLDALEEARNAGATGAIGLSVYTPYEAIRGLSDPRITHIQLPCNVLDHRWNGRAFTQARLSRPEVVWHGRSVFLQGLLLAPASAWPAWVTAAQAIADALDDAARPLTGGRIELCLRAHRSLGWLDMTIVGVASASQLAEIADAASAEPLDANAMEALARAAALAPARLLDPREW